MGEENSLLDLSLMSNIAALTKLVDQFLMPFMRDKLKMCSMLQVLIP